MPSAEVCCTAVLGVGALLVVLLPSLQACAVPVRANDGPEATLRAYARALAAGDAARAHALELPFAHRGRDVEAQAQRLGEAAQELAALGRALQRPDESAIVVHARVPLASGEQVVLVRGPDGRWGLEGGPIGAPALVTPRDAVAALRSALLRRDLRAIEELLARSTRAAWEAEVARLVEETEDTDALRIEVEGERARVLCPDGAVIALSFEAGEWRVVDVVTAP